MTQQFFTVLTNVGAAALANSIALGQDLAITSFAVGDGGGAAYAPTVEQLKASTDLVNETYSGAVNELKKDPDNPSRFYIEGVVPVDKGGWTVREAGWYLANGDLFAITKFPPSYKTVPADGAATELPVRTYIATGAADNIVLKIDPTIVMASRSYVDNKINDINKKFQWQQLALISVFKRHVLDGGQQYTAPNYRDDGTALQDGDWFSIRRRIGSPKIDRTSELAEIPKFKRLSDGVVDTSVTIVVSDINERVFVYNKTDNVWEF